MTESHETISRAGVDDNSFFEIEKIQAAYEYSLSAL